MLTRVLERTGHGSPGGCGLVDPPEVLYPAVDKGAIDTMKAKCGRLVRRCTLNPG